MTRVLSMIMLAMVALAGCGDDSTEAPDNMERNLPARVAPSLPPDPPDAGPLPPLEGMIEPAECCTVMFAIRDADGEQTEQGGKLRGSEAPLDTEDGINLIYEGGVWSASACVPQGADVTYYYEFALMSDLDEDESFFVIDTNPNVPRAFSDLHGQVNVLDRIESCDDDVSVHADTSIGT